MNDSLAEIPEFLVGASLFRGNRALMGEGGGVHVDMDLEEPLFSMANCLLHTNAALAGGGLFLRATQVMQNISPVRFRSNTVADNTCLSGGGGAGIRVDVVSSTPGGASINTSQFENNVIWGNRDLVVLVGGAPAISSVLTNALLAFDNSDVEVAAGTFPGGPGMINADPLFINAPGGNYRLSWSGATPSPCIDSGADDSGAQDLIDLDDDSNRSELAWYDRSALAALPNSRAVDSVTAPDTGIDNPLVGTGIIDMGAYECGDDAPPSGN